MDFQMNERQEKLNADYQAVLNRVYRGAVTVSGKFLNNKSVILHECSSCSSEFFGRPLWLINGRQPHSCEETLRETKAKQATKKAKANKSSTGRVIKVTEAMKVEMVQLYKAGESMAAIARKLNLTPQTVSKHLKIAKVELR